MNNISFIIYDGYYKNDDDDTVYSHTDYTWNLYNKGLEEYTKRYDILTSTKVYDGVLFIDNKPHAQIEFDEYVEIEY